MKMRASTLGVSGSAKLPDHGAVSSLPRANETKGQSCPTALAPTAHKPTQFRIYLPECHATRWLAIPPQKRKRITGLVFGAYTEKIDLEGLVAVASELQKARLAIINLAQLALQTDSMLNKEKTDEALRRISSLLEGKQ